MSVGVGRRFLSFLALALLILSIYQPGAYAQQRELKLSLSPSILPADGSRHGAIVIQLLEGGKPTPATEDMNVTLVSSNSIVGEPDKSVILKKGSYYTLAGFTTSGLEGKTNLTAVADGLVSNTVVLKTTPIVGIPTHIGLKLIPDGFEMFGNERGYLIVELEDGLGRPAIADHDVKVELRIDDPRIASIPDQIVIKKGESYSFEGIEIGGTPGSATITASAEGYGKVSASLSMTTREPSKLAVYMLPSEVTTGSTVYVFVQLLDGEGRAVRSIGTTEVFLSATGGRLQSDKLELKRGEYLTFTRLTVSSPGSFEVRAMSEGLGNSTAELEVCPPFYTSTGKVRIQTLPGILADSSTHDVLFVQLLDERGLPAIPLDDVDVRLFSSDPKIANVSGARIEKGKAYVVSKLELGHRGGEVWIDGHSVMPVEGVGLKVYGEEPTSLVVEPFLDPMLSGSKGHAIIYLSSDRMPVKLGGECIELNSSNPSLSVGIEEVTDYFVISNLTSETPGKYTLTASSKGLNAEVELTVAPSIPRGITLTLEPGTILADGREHDIGVIEFTDGEGNLMAPPKKIEVLLYSTPEASIPSKLEIPKRVPIQRFRVKAINEGVAKLTAVSEGVGIAEASLNLILLELRISVKVGEVTALEPASIKVSVTHDGAGVGSAKLNWDLPEGVEFSCNNETDPNGLVNATLIFRKSGKMTIKVRAEKEGYRSANATFELDVKPKGMEVLLISDRPKIGVDEIAHLTVKVVSDSEVVKGARLEWVSSLGIVTGGPVTDERGIGKGLLYPNGSGTAEIEVTATKEGYGEASATLTVSVISGIITRGGISPLLVLYVAIPIGGVVAFFIFWRRRRKKEEKAEEEEYV